MKNLYLIVFVISLFFVSCEKENGSLVEIQIKNSTGKDIKKLEIGNCKLGTINSGTIFHGKLAEINFEGIAMIDNVMAKLDGEVYSGWGSECGTLTMFNSYDEGYFELEVTIRSTEKRMIFKRTN